MGSLLLTPMDLDQAPNPNLVCVKTLLYQHIQCQQSIYVLPMTGQGLVRPLLDLFRFFFFPDLSATLYILGESEAQEQKASVIVIKIILRKNTKF